MSYLQNLKSTLVENANPEQAKGMEAYMKGKFKYLGISSPLRKEISAQFLRKDQIPTFDEMHDVVWSLWQEPWRELHYIAMELAGKYRKQWNEESLELFREMIMSNSWWDTVDHISSNLVGTYFFDHPEKKTETALAWNQSGQLWLERCSIIFQLKYKDKLDTSILSTCIESHLESKEFFLRKAIGWSLRQHSKYDPKWVRSFIDSHEMSGLSGLSLREASKYL